jgi:2-polyprenyl-3-methyl-5-hydroxy-6-metoxy-1,4-benzoquinol methylase
MNNAPCNHKSYKEISGLGAAQLLRCDQCDLIFTAPASAQPAPELLYEDYYKNEMANRFNPVVEFVVRLFRFFRAFKVFTLSPRAKTVLDVGSGRGWMLYYLKKYYGYARTAGTQISKNALDFSRDKLGLEIYDKELPELSLGREVFDIITIWHVLEHLKEPEKYIEKIRDLLKNDGKLIIEVPNFDSWTRRLAGKYWLSLDLDYHTHFFTSKSLAGLLEKYGFRSVSMHTFSLEYSAFTSAQSLISLLTGSDSLFFKSLQDGKIGWRIVPHAILFILLGPICLLINILFYFSKKGEVLLVVAEKNAK